MIVGMTIEEIKKLQLHQITTEAPPQSGVLFPIDTDGKVWASRECMSIKNDSLTILSPDIHSGYVIKVMPFHEAVALARLVRETCELTGSKGCKHDSQSPVLTEGGTITSEMRCDLCGTTTRDADPDSGDSN